MKKTQNVREGTRKGASRRKKELALALCVSLWMAGGSVAAAYGAVYINADTHYVVRDGVNAVPGTPDPPVGSTGAGTTLTVTGGDWSGDSWSIFGGYSTTQSVSGYNLILDGVTGVRQVRGAKSSKGSFDGTATGSSVTLIDSTINAVVGGDSNGYDVDKVTGNTLYLYGANTVEVYPNGAGSYNGGVVQNFETIHIKSATWGTPVLTLKGGPESYPGKFGIIENGTNDPNLKKAKIDASTLTFANPETVADGATMNLIECSGTATITADLAATTTTQEYDFTPVTGVTINAALKGGLALTNTALTYTATENKASKLTFADVEWKDSGAMMTRPANITFAGADVDTSNINFTNIKSLEANKKMTLVSDFGDTVGTITGTKYKVGSTLEGSGKASLVGNDLIFTAETSVESMTVQEQTHNTVMGAEVGMAALSVGNDFVGAATEGLSLASNIGADGVSSFAQMGGGSMRQETGSHIDSHTWNAIIALGHQNKKARGTFEYGAFFEYGSGNYSTFNGDERGDGSMHYTGGGLLAKYTTKDSVYVEGSLRAGSIHDDARNVLRDGFGNPYSYETNAPYMGFHLGVGKEIPLSDGNAVDVYGKYFYNRRNSVDFNAGGHYDLDAVTSSVIRLGARYIVKRDKWNFYAGAAYEHELDGKANGTADGVAIRGADTSGGSFRGELGATMTPGENSPWKLDLNVTGFAGKKQGFTGGVSVAFMF